MYLGINAFSHDASACLINNEGKILAAVEEERFTGNKHESRFPTESIKYCLETAGITSRDLRGVGYGWKPSLLLFQRILLSNLFLYPVSSFFIRKNFKKYLSTLSLKETFEKEIGSLAAGVEVSYYKHHQAHVASAFYASPFKDVAYLTLDGRGEWETGTWGVIENNKIIQKGSIHHPNSIGNLYVAVGHFCGFPTFNKAGTVMALTALGKPTYLTEFKELIQIDLSKHSDFVTLNRGYIDCTSGEGVPKKEMEKLFRIPVAEKGVKPTQAHLDIAATLQFVVENFILDLLNKIHKETGKENLVMAGGVCLNSVANGQIKEKTPFKNFFIQPAAHDAGLSLGAAYLLLHQNKKDKVEHEMKTACLGPSYTDEEILSQLSIDREISYVKVSDIASKTAELISQGKKVAWFQGRLEFGPRALGSRSILADARDKNTADQLNKIKSRESFRPFAISILEEKSTEWLVRAIKSPFMLLVDFVKDGLKEKVPAAQHVDGSVRVQTVNKEEGGLYYDLITEFYRITGAPLIINTSFNIKGKPIINSPKEALEAFKIVELDVLAIGSFLVTKTMIK